MGKRKRRASVEPAPAIPAEGDVPVVAEAQQGPTTSETAPSEAASGAEPIPASSAGADGDASADATTSRRAFIQQAGRAAVGAAGVLATISAARVLVPRGSGVQHAAVDLGRLSDYRPGTTTWFATAKCFVMRDALGVGVFSGRCTHLGCTVRRHAEGFVCPCHGARFDAEGKVTAGPARRDLPWHPIWLEPDGHLWADLAREQEPGMVDVQTESTEHAG